MKLSRLFGVTGILLLLLGADAVAEVPIVYVRCPRASGVVEVSGDIVVNGVPTRATRNMRGFDLYDVLPDVVHFREGFTAPCDLVYRAEDSSERILYDCSSTSTDEASCAAMDPAVSFDGRTIAFSVFRGPLSTFRESVNARVLNPGADNAAAGNVSPEFFPNRRLNTTEAQLHLVDVATGEITILPGLEGVIDSGPAFLPNGRLAFTSTRDGGRNTMVWRTNATSPSARIWSMSLDGKDLEMASHHGLSNEEHPYVLKDGRVLYTSWQIGLGLAFRHTNGSTGGFTTLGNLFHLYTQSPDGADAFAFFGQHSGDHRPSHFGTSHDAAHFITQTSDGRVWFADYYRGNNNGLGVVVGIMSEPEGQEGIAPEDAEDFGDIFAPRDGINFAPWSSNNDSFAAAMPAPSVSHPGYADPMVFTGKVGHPAALPDNGLMVTWGKGACSTVTSNNIFDVLGLPTPPHTSGSGQATSINVITSLGLDSPGCDSGIYRASVIPSVHPGDLEMIVDSPDWHEFMARAVVPYSDIFGVDKPELLATANTKVSRAELEVGTPFGLLGAASIVDRETHPRDGIHFAGEHQFHGQGTDTINYADEDLCGVRILGVMPNRGRNTHKELFNVAGERVSILGEISVRNRDANGNPVQDSAGKPDTSFLLRMPANTPYFMQGIDCDGRTLNTDQSWQHLRPGEEKTCGGCHVHSRAAENDFKDMFAATSEYIIPRLGEGAVPLLTGESNGQVTTRELPGYGLRIDFQEDIMPIFAARCVSCHGGSDPAGELALDRPGVEGIRDTLTPSTWWCLVADGGQECKSEAQRFNTNAGGGARFRRPQLTRYLRAFNSLGSLLYWKAGGQRTDGNTDNTFDESSDVADRDLDFGAPHTTDITSEELGLLSRWIDIGSPGGPMEALDTQKPTLHLAAIVEGESITELRIGTVDLGSGIAPGSLVVCLLGVNGECENIAGDAEMHGITAVSLSGALSDPAIEVYASVEDLSGNLTEVRHTLAWLASTPAPPEPGGDAGPGGEETPQSSGCGCNSSGGQSGLLWLLALGLFLLKRRRPVGQE